MKTNISADISSYRVEAGTRHLEAFAFRKCKRLASVSLPEGLLDIGDAAFSHCCSLRQIQIPASVERIGVAAFCKSGLETIRFMGIPKEIEPDAFDSCQQLKEIVVPKGTKARFEKMLDVDNRLIVEDGQSKHSVKPITSEVAAKIAGPTTKITAEDVSVVLKKLLKKRSSKFSYNYKDFYWAVGDEVNLRDLFSGPNTFEGEPSYQFRRKALFVFMKSATARELHEGREYELPANVNYFLRKYAEKYAYREPRIFLFVCDDGKTATVYDEVKYVRANKRSITVKSLLR